MDKIIINTLGPKRPIYKIKASKFTKLAKDFGGCFFYREENGTILVQPINEKMFAYMKSRIGRNHFKLI